jgi:hypothetical protein
VTGSQKYRKREINESVDDVLFVSPPASLGEVELVVGSGRSSRWR